MIKKKICPDCEGRGEIQFIYDNHFEPCNTCWYKGYIEVSMTNADYIRSMSDEELAELLHDVYREGCNYIEMLNTSCETEYITLDGLTQWIQEEYEEDAGVSL